MSDTNNLPQISPLWQSVATMLVRQALLMAGLATAGTVNDLTTKVVAAAFCLGLLGYQIFLKIQSHETKVVLKTAAETSGAGPDVKA